MNNKIKSQGKIQNLKRLQQVPVFENLRYTITDNSGYGIQSPTDGDMIFEFQGKIAIIVDYKMSGKSLEDGQYRTFTTLTNALQNGGYEGAYFIIAEHNTDIDTPTYDASTCVVKRVYSNGKWKTPKSSITMKQLFNTLISKHNLPLTEYIPPSYKDMLLGIDTNDKTF
jgi:hypothetical protein